jgi:hypothetical protein
LRFERISGLGEEQIDELERRVAHLLERPWQKKAGRPRGLTLREALVVTCGYLRQNITEEVWADIFGVSQATVSRCITLLTPLVEQATARERPSRTAAMRAVRGAIALVDGTLWPCWSWTGKKKLWAGKYKTTGHGSLIITNLQGRVVYISDPVTGNQHDMRKLKGAAAEKILKKARGVFGDKGFIGTSYITTPIRKPKSRKLLDWEKDWNRQVSSFRAPVERAIANLTAWRALFTDYRRPLGTFETSSVRRIPAQLDAYGLGEFGRPEGEQLEEPVFAHCRDSLPQLLKDCLATRGVAGHAAQYSEVGEKGAHRALAYREPVQFGKVLVVGHEVLREHWFGHVRITFRLAYCNPAAAPATRPE